MMRTSTTRIIRTGSSNIDRKVLNVHVITPENNERRTYNHSQVGINSWSILLKLLKVIRIKITNRQGRNLLTGQKKYILPGQRFIAAKSIIKKAVFCADNIDPSVTVDDLHLFVAGLTVQVVSCFSVRPRRRRNESESDPLRHSGCASSQRTEIVCWMSLNGRSRSSYIVVLVVALLLRPL